MWDSDRENFTIYPSLLINRADNHNQNYDMKRTNNYMKPLLSSKQFSHDNPTLVVGENMVTIDSEKKLKLAILQMTLLL